MKNVTEPIRGLAPLTGYEIKYIFTNHKKRKVTLISECSNLGDGGQHPPQNYLPGFCLAMNLFVVVATCRLL